MDDQSFDTKKTKGAEDPGVLLIKMVACALNKK